ncbi:MAG TPA: FAD:protein FMN transferase [Burkholderiaceae bacterium]|jgi:thiamine biosynthesis lipoprotein
MAHSTYAIAFGAMASTCEVRLAADDELLARHLAQIAIDEVHRIEFKYSRYRSDSIVSRINAAAGIGAIECDDETHSLFGYADTLFSASDGLFDITSGVLRRAWNFREARVPSNAELAPLLELIGWQSVGWRVDTHRIGLPVSGMEIDFGGFGKEYAADRAAAMLAEHGVAHGYVNLGGDMRILGPQPDGKPWSIGIQDPRQADRTIASIPIESGALTTSGDYERFFALDGRRYCHILNPLSGMPVQCWRSISVIAPLAVAAGSYSTIAMLKEHAALSFLDEAGVGYLAIDLHGKMHARQ